MQSSRRRFLQTTAVGTAAVSLPGIFAACGPNMRPVVAPSPPKPSSAASASGSLLPAQAQAQTYFESFGVDTPLLSRVITKGMSRGGDYCDVFLQHRISHWVATEDGEVNRAYTDVIVGAGVRVLKGDATGFAFSEDLSESALMAAAATAASIADGPATQQIRSLSAVSVPNRYVVQVPWSEVGIDKKLPLVQQLDSRARKTDSRITKVKTYLEDEHCQVLFADSEGRLVHDVQPMVVFGLTCVAEHKGRTETNGQTAASRDGMSFMTPERVETVAKQAAEWTVMLFDATQPPAGEYPVVLAPGLSGIFLHEAIGHGMEADFNRKGVSVYADRIGKRIAPPNVTIVDDGTLPRMRGSINVDDEGTEAQRTVLVENGILRSYMHDRISARHYKVASTGSGRRESFRFPPVPRMRNTYMINGPQKPEEIIASVKHGLYAEKFANGQVNIGAGDFSFYLKHGRLIENGKLTKVVKDANLIGSGPKVLETIEMVGDDLEVNSGAGSCGKDGQLVPVGFGLPTCRAGAISVGGKKS